MTCIDVHKRAERFGVRYEDYHNGRCKIANYIVAHKEQPVLQCRIDAVKMLPEREMVAVIRMDKLDVYLPDLFTRDGIKA